MDPPPLGTTDRLCVPRPADLVLGHRPDRAQAAAVPGAALHAGRPARSGGLVHGGVRVLPGNDSRFTRSARDPPWIGAAAIYRTHLDRLERAAPRRRQHDSQPTAAPACVAVLRIYRHYYAGRRLRCWNSRWIRLQYVPADGWPPRATHLRPVTAVLA